MKPLMDRFPEDYHTEQGVMVPYSHAHIGEQFAYSDGTDTENDIYNAVKAARDKSLFSPELSAAIRDWPSRYHLSPVRANLLRPLQPLLNGRVLELGAGCGAITRYLGEIGTEVVAVEGSLRRAQIARERTADLQNVTVVCSRIETFTAEQKFDVVTLIGVLEYARAHANYPHSHEHMLLAHAINQLAPDGILVVAIENKFGLKYLAGAPEDHFGIPYFGINDSYSETTVATYGLQELKALLRNAGLEHQTLLLPLPDYKLPVSVLSSEGARASSTFDAEALLAHSVIADVQRPAAPPFSLERAWSVAYKNGLASDLANSFLLVGGRSASCLSPLAQPEILAWHYSVERHPAFAKQTRFVNRDGKIRVERERLTPSELPAVPLCQTIDDGPFEVGRNWWLELGTIVNKPGWGIGHLSRWARPWIDLLLQECSLSHLSNQSFRTFVDGRLFDATPFNSVMDERGKLVFFDQEWRLSPSLELGFIIFRGLRDSILKVTSYSMPAAGTPMNINRLVMAILADLGVTITKVEIEGYVSLESRIQKWVLGQCDEAVNESLNEYFWTSSLNVRVESDRATLAEVQTALLGERERRESAELALADTRKALEAERQRRETLGNEAVQLRQQHSSILAKHNERQRRLASELAELKQELSLIRASTTWSLMQRASSMASRHPPLLSALRLLLRAAKKTRRRVNRALGRGPETAKPALFNPGRLLDEEWYYATYPDVARAGIPALEHYVNAGAKEGRDPNPLFDTDWYLAQNPDVAKSEMNPLEHYIKAGAKEGRDPSPLFRSDWYRRRYPDVAETGANPLEHYLVSGAYEGRFPNPAFDSRWYLVKNPDVAALGINPLDHFITAGAQEGRLFNDVLMPTRSLERYAQTKSILAALARQVD